MLDKQMDKRSLGGDGKLSIKSHTMVFYCPHANAQILRDARIGMTREYQSQNF